MNGITNIGEILNDLEIDRDAWQARAEAAEKRVAVAEEAASALSGVIVSIAEALGIKDSEPYLSRKTLATVKAQVERVQELESQLAAPAWRPVTEPPVKSGRYLIWNRQYPQFGVEMQFYDISTASWYTNDADEQSIDYPTHWRPLPAPPQDTPASGR